MSAHEPTGPAACSCGTPGYTARLACGHGTWTHGPARPGGWVSCQACQGQRKVLSCAAEIPYGQGVLFSGAA